MGMGAGVVESPLRVNKQLPNQSLTGKQPERIVDRGLGYRASGLIGQAEYLISRQVLWTCQYSGCNLDPLDRGADAVTAQQVDDFPAVFALLGLTLVHRPEL